MNIPRPPSDPLAKRLDRDYTDWKIFWARELEDLFVLDLRHPDDFFREKRMKLYKAAGPIPGLGRDSLVRLYGKRGFPVRGLDVDGKEVFYRPPEETLEGWWADVLARPGCEDEVLCAYEPRSWRTFLPGAPRRISVTRRNPLVATSANEEAFPLYDYLWAEPGYSRWSLLGMVLLLLNLVALFFLQAHPTLLGALVLISVYLIAEALSRSEDLCVSSGLDCTGGNRQRRYPIFGPDPAFRAILDVTHQYKKPSEKRYWRELLPSTSD